MQARTIIGLSLLGLLAGRPARAQFSPPTDTTGGKRGTYHVVVTVGVGSSQYASAIGIPPAWRQTEMRRLGQSVMIRWLNPTATRENAALQAQVLWRVLSW